MNTGMLRCGVLALAVAASAVGGLRVAPSVGHPRFVVDHPVAPAYQPIHMRVEGLYPGDRVTIISSAYDFMGTFWQASANFTVGGSGTVDLADQAPVSGSYAGASAMGLVWSMNPVSGPGSGSRQNVFYSTTYPEWQPSSAIGFTVSDSAGRLAATELTREWMGPGVAHTSLTLAANGVIGDLYLPPRGAAPRPALLLFGGSEGGEGERWTAAMLATEGYPALAVAYFHEPGLPADLAGVPLEYFAAAARLLAAQPGVDPAHVLAFSGSRGTEAALLLADHFPDLVHGAIVYSPSAVVNPGFPDRAASAWTLGGVAIPFGTVIPLDRVSGPVLAIAGSDDALWDSPDWTEQIGAELAADDDRYPYRTLIYPGAGHGISEDVDGAESTTAVQPITGHSINLGGSRPANAAGQEASWAMVLTLLASLERR